MANSKDILDINPSSDWSGKTKLVDSYLGGITKLYEQVSGSDPSLRKMRLHFSKLCHNDEIDDSEEGEMSDGSDI